jgi:large conductance mechanosensitive channel
MIKGFRDFIMRGNVIDLAVAVVVGAAFTALVNAIVESIVNPIIQLFWKTDEKTGKIGIPVEGFQGEVIFPIGTLINAIITFLAVAVVVYFVFVYPMNRFKERAAAKAGVVEKETPLPTEQELLVQIRDLLEQQGAGGASAAPTRSTPPVA